MSFQKLNKFLFRARTKIEVQGIDMQVGPGQGQIDTMLVAFEVLHERLA